MSSRSPGATGPTVYIPAPDFDGGEAEVTGDLYRHLFRARRLAAGDPLRVVDGEARARSARIVAVHRDRAELALGESLPVREPALRLTLVVAMPRPERASWLVEKATELGVAGIDWLRSERGPRACSEAALERHRRIAQAAMQQCGGALLPEFSVAVGWRELARRLADFDQGRVLDARGARTLDPPQGGRCAALVGPEGGWTDSERADLEAWGCLAWSLGPRALRVETAALVAAGRLLGDG